MSETKEEQAGLSHYDLQEEFTAHEAACLIAGLDPEYWEAEQEAYRGRVSVIKEAMARDWERTYNTAQQGARQWLEAGDTPFPDKVWRKEDEFLPSKDFWVDWTAFTCIENIQVFEGAGPIDESAFDEVVFQREDVAAWLRAQQYRHARYFWTEGDRERETDTAPSRPEVERERILRLVGALALLLAEKSGKYRVGEKPNALQIANAVEVLVDAMPDANQRGLGKTNVRDSIGEGVRLLQG